MNPNQSNNPLIRRIQIQTPFATDTHVLTFLINVFHIGARLHHADLIVAMDQSKGMAQFVNHLFAKTFQQDFIIPF